MNVKADQVERKFCQTVTIGLNVDNLKSCDLQQLQVDKLVCHSSQATERNIQLQNADSGWLKQPKAECKSLPNEATALKIHATNIATDVSDCVPLLQCTKSSPLLSNVASSIQSMPKVGDSKKHTSSENLDKCQCKTLNSELSCTCLKKSRCEINVSTSKLVQSNLDAIQSQSFVSSNRLKALNTLDQSNTAYASDVLKTIVVSNQSNVAVAVGQTRTSGLFVANDSSKQYQEASKLKTLLEENKFNNSFHVGKLHNPALKDITNKNHPHNLFALIAKSSATDLSISKNKLKENEWSPVQQGCNLTSSSFFLNNSVNYKMKKTPPLCLCGRRALRKIVQSAGENCGRAFFCCSKNKCNSTDKNNVNCKFFRWESQHELTISNSTLGLTNNMTSINNLSSPNNVTGFQTSNFN